MPLRYYHAIYGTNSGNGVLLVRAFTDEDNSVYHNTFVSILDNNVIDQRIVGALEFEETLTDNIYLAEVYIFKDIEE